MKHIYYQSHGVHVFSIDYKRQLQLHDSHDTEREAMKSATDLEWRAEICGYISDAHKDAHGFRSRSHYENTNQELVDYAKSLSDTIGEQIADEREHEASIARMKMERANKKALTARRFEQSFNSIGAALTAA
tara:strand:+ start:75 stop:470 length:396 start_codon:yes stop_codon:yes gene_type:complete